MFRELLTSVLIILILILFSIGLVFYAHQNKQIKIIQEANNNLSVRLNETQSQNETEILKLNERLSVIDASISPDNKKWSRIKHIRKIVVDVMRQKGTNNLTILEITEICKNVVEYSEEYDVPSSLVLAVITVESAFKIDAISKAHARGLMQLLDDTATEISMEIGKRNFNLFRIRDNIQLGTYYLWKMNNLFGDLGLAIRAYNCGPICVERVKSGEYSNYPKETVDYLEKVNMWRKKYTDLGID